MQFKSLLSFAILAIAAVKADKSSSSNTCNNKKGMFLENPSDPNDTRYACFLPRSNFRNPSNYYCGTYDGFSGCYERTLGNMNYCDKSSKEFNSRGCALGIDYLSNMIYFEKQRHQNAKDECKIKGGQMYDSTYPNDFRYACFLPTSNYSNPANYFCGTHYGFSGCYERSLSNMEYCDMSSKEFNSRGCALGVGALAAETYNADIQKKESSKKTCQRKHGIWFENPTKNTDDRRFTCFLPDNYFQDRTKVFCGSYNGYSGCYEPTLGNMDYCDMSSKQFNSRGCALSMYYLSEWLVKY